MRLEEDLKNNVRSENPSSNTGQSGFQRGNSQGHWNKNGSFGRPVSNSSLSRPGNKAPTQNTQGRTSNACPTCGRFHGDRPCFFEAKACFNCGRLETLLKIVRLPKRTQWLNLKEMIKGEKHKEECLHSHHKMFKLQHCSHRNPSIILKIC